MLSIMRILLISSLLFKINGQNKQVQKWIINKNISWLNDTLFKAPNLYYEIKFTIEFDKINCCPTLDVQSYPREEFSSGRCFNSSTVYGELIWFKNSIFVLDPTKENAASFIKCNLNEQKERYTCKLTVQGLNHRQKKSFLALGYFCGEKRKSLQNTSMEVEILHEANTTVCEPIEKSRSALACENYYTHVAFPNLWGHYKQTEAAQALELVKTVFEHAKTLCHEHIFYGVCQAFFPACPTGNKGTTPTALATLFLTM